MKTSRFFRFAAVIMVFALTLCGCASSDGYSPQEIFSRFSESVVHIETSGGGGTGFFIEENVIVTNNHVITDAQWLTVKKTDGSVYDVTSILACSESPDLAMLSVDCTGTPLKLNTHGINTGEPVYAIGAPMGIFPCLSDGIVMKSLHHDGDVDYFLSNFHSIGGNSGGPVLNAYGELMGIVVGGFADGPNSIDTVILADYLDDMDRSNPTSIMTKARYEEEMNRLEEEKHEHASSIAQAQPGQIITFGSYEQDGDLSNGAEKIYWLVTERKGNELTLMSLYCLDKAPYSLEQSDVTWETSHVRAFLNGEFYNAAFSSDEQAVILETIVPNAPNPEHGTDGGADTLDRVWLPSLDDITALYGIPAEETFFPELYAPATPYAISKGLWLEIEGSNRCWWWLRSPGGNPQNAAEVGSAGYLSLNGSEVSNPERALRPVIRITAE